MIAEKFEDKKNCNFYGIIRTTSFVYSLDKEINLSETACTISKAGPPSENTKSQRVFQEPDWDSLLQVDFCWRNSDQLELHQFKQEFIFCNDLGTDLLPKNPKRQYRQTSNMNFTVKELSRNTQKIPVKSSRNTQCTRNSHRTEHTLADFITRRTEQRANPKTTQTSSESSCSAQPYPVSLILGGRVLEESESNRRLKETRNPSRLFFGAKFSQLQNRIEARSEFRAKFGIFDPRDAFVASVKRELGSKLNDRARTKTFNFLALKILWSQFLSGERIEAEYIRRLSPFEQLLFRTFLVRRGYTGSKSGAVLKRHWLESVSSRALCRNSEQSMLSIVLKAVFKRLMHPFSNSSVTKPFHSDMDLLPLSNSENNAFYSHYFGTGAERDCQISDRILRRSELMAEYIHKMGQSEQMRVDVFRFLYAPRERSDSWFQSPGHYSIGGSEVFRRHKYEIADKINKRLSNYEIVLNQFDPKHQSEQLLRWMAIILRDLGLNPEVNLPWNVVELEEAIQLFLRYFVK